MSSYATVGDVAVELGREIEPPETEQIEAWLTRVESRIRLRFVDLDDRAVDLEFRARLVGVEVEVVARKVRNPDGKSYERIDDYGYGLAGATSADLTLTDSDWAQLVTGQAAGAFSVRPTYAPDWRRSPW